MAQVRRAKMLWREHPAGAAAVLQKLAPRFARVVLVGTRKAVPVREIELNGVVDHVAGKEGLLALRVELDHEVPRRMAGRGLDREMFVDPLRALDHLGEAGLDDR